jgi:hypothetical protein
MRESEAVGDAICFSLVPDGPHISPPASASEGDASPEAATLLS